MKDHARNYGAQPVLVDRNAGTFGTAGSALEWRGKHEKGTLILTEEALVFDHLSGPITIPLERINRLGVGLRHHGKTGGVPVLRVTYNGNLVLGILVANPMEWIHAMETLTGRIPHSPATDRRRTVSPEVRTFRTMAATTLLLIILFAIVLPFFYAWMQSRTVREVPAVSQLNPGTGTSG